MQYNKNKKKTIPIKDIYLHIAIALKYIYIIYIYSNYILLQQTMHIYSCTAYYHILTKNLENGGK